MENQSTGADRPFYRKKVKYEVKVAAVMESGAVTLFTAKLWRSLNPAAGTASSSQPLRAGRDWSQSSSLALLLEGDIEIPDSILGAISALKRSSGPMCTPQMCRPSDALNDMPGRGGRAGAEGAR